MNNRGLRQTLFLLILLQVSSTYAQRATSLIQSPQPQDEVSYLFVSPNTSQNLTLKEARQKLNSREEIGLIVAARNLSHCLRLKAVIAKTVGNWTDGAEHSILIKVNTDEATVRYLDSRLGSRALQKSVLYFQRRSNGEARMYVLYLVSRRHSLTTIARVLDRTGISNRTLLPLRRGTVIYIVDLKDELRKQIAAVVLRLGVRYTLVSGVGGFIGSGEDVNEAQKVYSEVIKGYEAEHPQARDNCKK